MRHAAQSREIAELAVRYRDDGVVGFDIAGAEAGFPPTRHLDAFEYLRRENAHFTIHAGEAFGLPSIWEALQWCGADRLGHGVRIVDDITVRRRRRGSARPARGVRAGQADPAGDGPESNVQTGAAPSIVEHPIGLLRTPAFPGHRQHRQPVDERLHDDLARWPRWSRPSATAGRTCDWLTVNAMKSAFLPFDERLVLINEVIKPAYAALR